MHRNFYSVVSNIYLAHMAPRIEHLGTNNLCQLGTESLNSKGFSDLGIDTWLLAAVALAESHWTVQMLVKARLIAAGTSFRQMARLGTAAKWSFTDRATERSVGSLLLVSSAQPAGALSSCSGPGAAARWWRLGYDLACRRIEIKCFSASAYLAAEVRVSRLQLHQQNP